MRLLTQAVLTFLLNAIWQAALLVAFAVFADWLLRGIAAQYRHALWIVTLLVCVTLPILSTSTGRKPITLRNSVNAPVASGPVVITRIITPDVEVADAGSVDSVTSPDLAAKRRVITWHSVRLPSRAALTILGIYIAFLLSKLLLLLRAWRRTQSILRGASASPLPDHLKVISDRCSRLIGVKRIRILHSREVPVPITLGIAHPIIVLPESLLEETDRDLLSSAIGHELVHVARRDYLWNLVFESIYLPLSFHPAAALVRRRIRQTRELCCDEIVARKLLNAEAYAHSLMRLIGSAPSSPRLISDTTIGLNQSDILEVRIMSLLNAKNRKSGSPRSLLIAAALILTAPCIVGTKLALKLDVYAQEPAQTAQEKEVKQKLEKTLQGLRDQERDLNEKLKGADETQRKEIEARLQEVKKTLEEHERAVAEFRYQEESLGKLRALIGEYERTKTVDAEQLKRMEAELAKLESEYPRDDALLREAKEKLDLIEKETQQYRKAKLIYRVEPDYTPDAREKQITGTVVLGVTVGHDGTPHNIQIKKSLFPSLDESAVAAVRKWRFEPAMQDGQPVSMYIQVEFYFSPDGKGADIYREKEEREKTEAERGYAESSGEVYSLRRSKERQGQEQEEREKRQSELTRDAVVPMDRAIQIATSQVPGKVLACSLGRDGDMVFYHVVIVSTEGNQTSATEVWVSAADGHVIKTEKEKRRAIQGGALNDKVVSMPNPEYPAIARAAKASGTVTVEIIVDEAGNVVAARAVSGHPLLQAAAVNAARQAKFTPTSVNGEPTKISGYLTYNFIAQ